MSYLRYVHIIPLRAGPLAALWLKVEHATSNSVGVSWEGPKRSDSALGGFAVRYRTRAEPRWTALELLPPGAGAAEIANMTHGEHYIIRLDAVSEDADGETVESEPPVTTEHTVRECRPAAPQPTHTHSTTLLGFTRASIGGLCSSRSDIHSRLSRFVTGTLFVG